MDIEELVTTAQLAHLKVDKTELAASLPAFEQMLEFFAVMRAADNDENLTRTVMKSGAAHFRSDTPPDGDPDRNLNESILNNPGERDGRFVVIPNVL
ncbi:MAG: aspartyl/glutamyl-tRNA amidotransferase subunit C [Spirochaetaceae bacterium]|jgi:aspartyl-tRNA(Asn)/glutamyl-tRNA(Gln) amidotransferase subunit C|nr:aspartyl/glutamyl-tRNA amidotransferase subunit C [Spirochaetaceae bacterium]